MTRAIGFALVTCLSLWLLAPDALGATCEEKCAKKNDACTKLTAAQHAKCTKSAEGFKAKAEARAAKSAKWGAGIKARAQKRYDAAIKKCDAKHKANSAWCVTVNKRCERKCGPKKAIKKAPKAAKPVGKKGPKKVIKKAPKAAKKPVGKVAPKKVIKKVVKKAPKKVAK